MTTRVLELDGVDVSFGFGSRRKHVLHDVGLTLDEGRTLGLVGESGSGKSTLAKVVVGLVRPAAGRILIDGEDMAGAGRERIARLRRRIQLIPQDPYASLNPRMTVGDALAEAIDPLRGRAEAHRDTIAALLAKVSMDADAADRYPHAFSGGQRQRIAIARALAVGPEVIVADEVTSALDCSVQAEVLGVLRDLRASMRLTMLFISHDLAVVRHVSDEVAVMSGGRIVEHEQRDRIFASPQHDYTKLLLASVPDGKPLRERRGTAVSK
ncbi:ATP-binding cassette domain-containing protein [Streptomyces indicus]|uniref:ABC transporter n=1 Tax=Streptomyces indicus TaxID=417292 RepID=A0A1G8YGY9_9ACTN|nr:ATP-binding cassette domain-containing protein [Streptomyces indicus]SDK02006.1 ABC transporter [Streptomyces indicus]